jgi:hypothetical protein
MERADSGEMIVPLPPVVGSPCSQCRRPGQAVTSETVHVRRARQCSGHACPNLRPSAPPGPVNDAGWSGHFGPEISGVSSDAAAVRLHPSRAPACRTYKPSPVKDTLMRGSAQAPRGAPDVAPPEGPHARARCTVGGLRSRTSLITAGLKQTRYRRLRTTLQCRHDTAIPPHRLLHQQQGGDAPL